MTLDLGLTVQLHVFVHFKMLAVHSERSKIRQKIVCFVCSFVLLEYDHRQINRYLSVWLSLSRSLRSSTQYARAVRLPVNASETVQIA